ncbi:hypothetical protein [Parasphingorhabdus cellanae]|uniref:Uncharacterized protein n=1 Tax=Parasphingorhabdus cellanae TaxID=2806553 RepID=A0ABX7T792_9SPHN|nr:hypothetical protein [Parasphingorhabdus cellanae]QTD57474.1 hypothetical protein J4G78_08100 [Parasphingorhabdus cellanae]
MIANRFNFDVTTSNRNYSRHNLQLANIPDVSPRLEDEASALLDQVSGFTGSSWVAKPVVSDYWNSAPLVISLSFKIATISDPALVSPQQEIARHIGTIGGSTPYSKAKKRKNRAMPHSRSVEGRFRQTAEASIAELELASQHSQSQLTSVGAEKMTSLEHIKIDPCRCSYWLARLIIWGGRHSR